VNEEMPWWKEAVFYQVYPRSFLDANGDGVGDLRGVRERLDHLSWLGVDAVWLSPFYRSPMVDFGYDISDHCDVDPLFGDLGEFDALLGAAHRRGIRVLVDLVPNHTSDRHPWFVESRSSRFSRKRDWYIWRDGYDGTPPNNWRAAFGGPAWTWDDATRQWYLHLFLPEQPDLNWANDEVVEAMHGVMRFWLDRGVDGFRVDVIHCIGKDELLPDQPPEFGEVDRVGIHDYAGTHALIRSMRAVLDRYPGGRVMVGEVNLRETIRIATYYGEGDELHLAFNFLSLDAGWHAGAWTTLIETVARDLGPDAWPTWVLSNHDNPRHRTRFGGSEHRARAAAVLLLTLRGTPFLYAGEELGLEDALIRPELRVDPGGRDGCRAPLPWDAAPGHGWSGADPWLPWPPEAGRRNARALRRDRSSILHLYRRLLTFRNASPALRHGSLELLPAPDDVVAYKRELDSECIVVAVNFGAHPAAVGLDGEWTLVLETAGYDGALPPDSAVVLAKAA
jgi:alpha-glucosidase